MHNTIEKGAAWLGLAMLGRIVRDVPGRRRLIPPMDPSVSAAEIAMIYSDHGLRIRIGLALMTLSAVCFNPVLRGSWHARCDVSRATGASCGSPR
jgi:hypothetical protein